ALRKSLLYQTPHPIFAADGDEEPSEIRVRLKPAHYDVVMRLIHKAGGWTLPQEDRSRILAEHEARARRAHGDGVDYDFSEMAIGVLYAMHKELKGVGEFADFREAIGEEIKARRGKETQQ